MGARVEAIALEGIPIVAPGDDLAKLVGAALARGALTLQSGDVIAVASKLVSRAEDRFVSLAHVEPGARAKRLASITGHDPAHVEVILRESIAVSRAVKGALITRHRLGFVVANAGVDFSNVGADDEVLLLPEHPDATASRLSETLGCAIVISDSFGRAFRRGSVGIAIGAAGLPALHDQRGRNDLFGRALEHTETALADQVAALADLVLGQADEARGAVLVRGLRFPRTRSTAAALVRSPDEDLYA
ncbi:MAG TPA: coenzyme F420-0:L-glutamate ligase [Kofleriaceae bacterium]|nr:coenzyme F420-0:L-glutamate ligase [Kofleriaceae bacterium]